MFRLLSSQCFSGRSLVILNIPSQNLRSSSYITSKCQISSTCFRNGIANRESSDSDETLIIYKGKLERQITRVKLFSLTTTAMGLGIQPMLYAQASSLPVLIVTCTVAGFFTFVTPVLLNLLAKRYVNQVSYDIHEDMYYAHTRTFFLRKKKIPIQPGEAVVPDQGSMFSTVEVRGIPLMIELNAVESDHLRRLLGYDKPLNIEHDKLQALIKDAEEQQNSVAEKLKPEQESNDKKSRSSSRL